MAAIRTAKKKRKVGPKVSRGPTAPNASNPALEKLNVLVGEWDMELSNAAFLASPSDTAKGHVSFAWVEDGAFMVMHMGDKPSGAPEAIWLFGRDESRPHYMALYYDSRRVSRVYEMSFSDGIWKVWRESPGFWQRYEGKVSPDGNTITGHWEKSGDGAVWEHDFDVTYKKVK